MVCTSLNVQECKWTEKAASVSETFTVLPVKTVKMIAEMFTSRAGLTGLGGG